MEPESRRQALYTGLTDVLGPDLTASLMSFLPNQPATALATSTDIQNLGEKIEDVERRLGARIDELGNRLGARIDELDNRLGARIDHLSHRLDHLAVRMDRLHDITVYGSAIVVVIVLAVGFLT